MREVQERGTVAAVAAGEATSRRDRSTFVGVATAVVLADQATKHWALAALADGPVDLIGSWRLNLTFNDGSAFGLGAGRAGLVAAVAVLVSVAVVWAGWRAADRGWAAAFGVVLGGAVGNLVDRALRDGDGFMGGRVVDFVDLRWWPIFNVADVAICVGAAALVLLSWRAER
ncbi:MAG: signal peptidase II [Acidimicrobiia bacterium]